MKRILLVLILLAGLSPPAFANFNEGMVAYLAGDYERAYATMRSLAEASDHGLAMYFVAMMHLNGQGVPQSYEEAGKWFRRAAEQRIPQAQHKLAELYFNGQGLPRDYEQAYAWYQAAAAHKHKLAMGSLEKARDRLSAEELQEAEKLSARLVRDYGPTGDPDEMKVVDPE
jgi:TPR repeat protein